MLEDGLADELVLIVYPVLLGTGERLFAQGTPARVLESVSTQAAATGVRLARYRVSGALKRAQPRGGIVPSGIPLVSIWRSECNCLRHLAADVLMWRVETPLDGAQKRIPSWIRWTFVAMPVEVQ